MALSEDTFALPNHQELPTTLNSTMPQSSYPCNTWVYDANVPPGIQPRLVAGFMQLGQTTAEEFYYYLEFCFARPPPRHYRLMFSDGMIVPRDANIVAAGIYYVVTPGHPSWVLL